MITTERLLIRPWRNEDVEPFHAMHAEPEVIRFLSDEPPTRAEIVAAVARQRAFQRDLGHCFWALERRDTGAFIGFCGLKPGPEGTPIEADVEIGWRLARPHWRLGFAHEAARACLGRAWAAGVARVAAITVPANDPSRRLMEKLGMVCDRAEHFNHPSLPPGHRLRPHLTYRIARP